MARSAFAGAAGRSSRSVAPLDPSEEEESLLRQAGRAGLSGLAAVGNVLDLPGSMVRDTIGGENPFDQLLPWNWASSENRLSGRDLARQWGVAGPEDTWGNFFGGLGVELATDPLTYLSFGGSALTKSGSAARRAGLMDLLPGKAFAEGLGNRVARSKFTPDDLIRHAPDPAVARQAFDNASGTMGRSADDLLQQPVGAAFGAGLPFADPIATFNGGKLGHAVNRGLDAAGEAIKYSAPVRLARGLLDPSAGNTFSKLGQQVAEAAYRGKRGAETIAREAYMRQFDKAKDVFGAFDDEFGEGIRRSAETDLDPRDLNSAIDDVIGRKMDQWSDPSLAYDREFRRKNLRVVNDLRRGKDPHGILGFDELRQEYGIETGIDLDEAAFTDMLLKTDPRPSRSAPDVVSEATRHVRNGQLQPTAPGVGDEAQWTINGADQFKTPKKIKDIQVGPDGKEYALFEGEATGAPLEQLTRAGDSAATVGHDFAGGDVVLAGDRGNYGYVRRVGPKSSEVFFRNPETGATATRIMPNDQIKRAFGKGSKEADEFASLMTRKVFHDIVQHAAETGDVAGAFHEFAGVQLPKDSALGKRIVELADDMKAANQAIHQSIEAKGGKTGWVKRGEDDFGIDHFPRFVDRKVAKESAGGASILQRSHGGMKARTAETRNIPESAINRMLRENRYRSGDVAKKIREDFGEYLDPHWGEEADSFNFGAFDDAADGKTKHAEALADWIAGRDKRDLYTRDYLDNFLRYQRGAQVTSRTLDAVHDVFKRYSGAEGEATLSQAFRAAGMDPDRSLSYFAERFGVSPDEVANLRVPKDVIQQATGLSRIVQEPEWASALGDAVDGFTQQFKKWVTVPFPSFAARNLVSGQHVNLMSGLVQGAKDLADYVRSFGEAHKLQKAARGGKLSEVDRNLLREMASQQLVPDHGFEDIALRSGGQAASQDPLMGIVPDSPFDFAGTAQTVNQTIGDNPSLIDALPMGAGIKGRQAAGKWVEAGSRLNQQVEWQNRATMYIYLRKKGFSAESAARRVEELQFNYADVTSFERDVMKRAFPFYSFTRKAGPMLLNALRERPGGPWGMTIRATNNARSKEPQPDYINSTTAIPLGTSPDGTQSFLSGFGLAHEVPLGFFGGTDLGSNLRAAGEQGLGMLNPIAKGPLEWATGDSFFQKGRDLEELDPPVGRTLANLGLADIDASGRALPFLGSNLLEHAVSNSPAARLVGTARTLTDPRKRGSAGALSKMGANLLTGVNVTDVSPARQDAEIRKAATKIAKQAGAPAFETVRYPKKMITETATKDPAAAKRMMAFNRLMSQLQERAKKRKEEAKAGK